MKRNTGLSDRDEGVGINEKGICYDKKKEEVPLYNSRDGDYVIHAEVGGGTNNNAWLVLGRDRPAGACSGYGGVGHSGTGAIDIVVGRMAPYPLNSFPENKKESVFVDPMFNAIQEESLIGLEKPSDPLVSGNPSAGNVMISGEQLTGEPGLNTSAKEGIFMDAARIYISQKADIDHYFGLVAGSNIPSPSRGIAPRSAVAMKADGIRIIAREGIKLVTMGSRGNKTSDESYNSQGGRISATYGIELIAGNGVDQNGKSIKQEPLIRGRQLTTALRLLAGHISTLSGTLASFTKNQLEFNKSVMSHTHGETFLGAITLTSPTAQFAGVANISSVIGRDNLSIINMQQTLGKWATTWCGEGSARIYSKYNTTN